MIQFARCSLVPLFVLAVACGSDADPGTNTTTGAGATGAGATGGTATQTTGAAAWRGTAPGAGAGGVPRAPAGRRAAAAPRAPSQAAYRGGIGDRRHGWNQCHRRSEPGRARPAARLEPVPQEAAAGRQAAAPGATLPARPGRRRRGPAASTTNEEVTNFDGGMKRFTGNSSGGDEGQDPIFIVKNGGTLKNVIIGSPPADGIHCEGTRTLQNVWWEAVGDDAATLEGSSDSQVMTIDCGGVKARRTRSSSTTALGKMVIKNFTASTATCPIDRGNRDEQHERHVELEHHDQHAPHAGGHQPRNYGDTATFDNIVAPYGVKICERYQGQRQRRRTDLARHRPRRFALPVRARATSTFPEAKSWQQRPSPLPSRSDGSAPNSALLIHDDDTVFVALRALAVGDVLEIAGERARGDRGGSRRSQSGATGARGGRAGRQIRLAHRAREPAHLARAARPLAQLENGADR